MKHKTWIALFSLLALLAGGQIQDAWRLSRNIDPRATAYRTLGVWLRDNTPSEARVAALEVGMIGYYGERPMVDFSGLLQPDVAPRLAWQPSYEGAAQWAVETYRPDYIVLCENQFPNLEQVDIARQWQVKLHFSPEKLGGFPCAIDIYTCSY